MQPRVRDHKTPHNPLCRHTLTLTLAFFGEFSSGISKKLGDGSHLLFGAIVENMLPLSGEKKLELPVPEWQTQHGCVCVFEFKKKYFCRMIRMHSISRGLFFVSDRKYVFNRKQNTFLALMGFRIFLTLCGFGKKKKVCLRAPVRKQRRQ